MRASYMFPAWRQVLLSLVLLCALLVAPRAAAWTEATIQSDVVTLDVERDGSAVVSHELLMRVRGGPLTSFELDGVCADAEPLNDGQVFAAASGARGSTPTPLLLH